MNKPEELSDLVDKTTDPPDINDRSSTPTSWYEVREVVEIGGVEKLFVPRENPREYEYSIDFCFATEEDAQDWINNTWIEEKNDFFEALADKFPTLDVELRYFESGAAFNGLYSFMKGEPAYDESGDYFGNRGG